LTGLHRSLWYYQSKRDDSEVVAKLNTLAETHPTRGFDEYYGRIRNEGLVWNRKRVLRVYRQMNLNIRRKRKRRLPARIKESLAQPQGINHTWSMDFMSDSLVYGRRFRVLNIIDDYNREALAIEPDFSLPGERVVSVLDEVIAWRGKPSEIRVDNGPEFISKSLQKWADKNHIRLKHIQPGNPTQNAYIERFNRFFREDVLDAYLFNDLSEVKSLAWEWMTDYNQSHPHKSLGGISPKQYVKETDHNPIYKSKESSLYEPVKGI
jgi:putative transposase